jgi:hypothetical protein
LTSKIKHQLICLIDSSRKKITEYRHHRIHKKSAFRYIEKVERLNGWKLTPKIKKLADDYAIAVFGKKEYAPWLYFFSIVQGEFTEGWIPMNFYSAYVLPDYGLTRISAIKSFSKVVLKTDSLPDIAYFINGKFYGKDYSLVSLSDLREMVASHYSKVFAKGDNSLRGLSIHKLGVEEINEDTFNQIGNCVIQYSIQQHALFSEMNPSTTATIRMVTVRNSAGSIEFRSSHLKLGRKGSDWYQSENCIKVGVINNLGELDSFGYTQDYQQVTKHPDSHVPFTNKKIPRFTDAIDMCVKLHSSIPHFPIVGWDITIDHQENIKVLEWNAGIPHPGVRFNEAVLGPCFIGLGWENLRK